MIFNENRKKMICFYWKRYYICAQNLNCMKKRIIISTIAIVTAIFALLFIQYFWNERMFRSEQKLVKLKAYMVLNDALDFNLQSAVFERYDKLESTGVSFLGEAFGSDLASKTVTVKIVHPEPVKIVRQCETDEEWHKFSKTVQYRYHYTGINLSRLDSLFKTELEKNEITLPYMLALRDSSNTILEQIPCDVDFDRYQLSLDTIPLGIDNKDFLVARFDGSYYGMFRQMRYMSLVSLGIVTLLIAVLIYTGLTIYYQKREDERNRVNQKNIAHNLMNQLVYIDKALSVIEVEETQQKYVRTMRQKSVWMSLLIYKLQRTSLNKQTFEICPENTCLNEFTGNIVDQFKAEHENFNFHFISEDVQPIMACVDTLHFGYALINLIENAVKYSGDNRDIYIDCRMNDNKIHISVTDHGIGIPPAHICKIFNSNYRVPESESLPQKGFGLGLYYVKIVAKSHGGEVTVESQYGKGSEFTLILPATTN